MPELITSRSDTRTIRVFISSTFRDMKDEREELVKQVFPQIRKLCESRGVTWCEVDLRWGITDEEASEGKVLPICLEEIRGCRPYFIGILGDRYGWIPKEISQDLVEREPWLEEHKKKSVTELEILHGVLNDPEMAGRAFFYFRDPEYIESLPENVRDEFRETADQGKVKLAELKDSIRGSGFPLEEDYPDPQAFGELVLADLTELIDNLYPEGTEPDPLEKEAQEHEAFARSRFGIYIGRQEYFDSLDEHVKGDGPPLVVLGDSGSGKSALLSNWALNYQEKHPDEHLLMHFIGGTPQSADWASMLRRIMGEFKKRFEIEGEIPTDPNQLRSTFTNWLYMVSAKGKVILILDALNQLEDRDGALDLVWLPPKIPENIRLILSTLPGRPLEDVEKRKWPTIEVTPLEDVERKQLIQDYLAQYRKSLTNSQVERIASADQTRNPLFLRAMLEELRLFGEHEKLAEKIEHYLTTKTVPGLFEKILERYETDYERDRPGLVKDAMSLIWASRRGLTESELLEILGTADGPLPRAHWSPLHLAAEQSLISRAGLIGFFHDYLRQAVESRYLPGEDEKKAGHIKLADYFEKQEYTDRVVDEFPWQLSEAEQWERLYNLLADLDFFGKAWKYDEFDVKRYWACVENSSNFIITQAYKIYTTDPRTIATQTIANYIFNLYRNTGYKTEALDFAVKLGDIASQNGDIENTIVNKHHAAVLNVDLCNYDAAMELLEELKIMCEENNNDHMLARCLCSMTIILQMRGELDKALQMHQVEEALFKKVRNIKGVRTSLGNQGIALRMLGDFQGAMKLQKKAEAISRKINDINGICLSLGNQAIILNDLMGESEKALRMFGEIEHTYKSLGDLLGLSICLLNSGDALSRLGRYDEAKVKLLEALPIAKKISIKSLVNTIEKDLVQIEAELTKPD